MIVGISELLLQNKIFFYLNNCYLIFFHHKLVLIEKGSNCIRIYIYSTKFHLLKVQTN